MYFSALMFYLPVTKRGSDIHSLQDFFLWPKMASFFFFFGGSTKLELAKWLRAVFRSDV